MKNLNSDFVETVSAQAETLRSTQTAQTIEITSQFYATVAETLVDAIGSANSYNSSVESRYEQTDWCLTSTLIIYRELTDPQDDCGEIIDAIPVWWEFHTYTTEQGEILNDFSFSSLKEHIIPAKNAIK